ncbi:hypothetical protein [Aminobacter sp. AP02]|uniref:hypothetical protein n=1 Tax=Aminobacter sp. AP02 TaxID=2135737 RepID=UPI000D79164C|nr:hypothetical protein [Aminobacter sp. AP02]PWK76140.1 hypothetical protein C8K44_102127 [Aminobacter sp. AP02]
MVGYRRKGAGFGVALAAALMLILQTVAGAVALGQGTPPLDIFGNPLCISSAGGHTAPAKSEHPSLPECCTLGCNMTSAAFSTPPEGVALATALPVELVVRFPATWLDLSTAPKYAPGNPRAPPLAA